MSCRSDPAVVYQLLVVLPTNCSETTSAMHHTPRGGRLRMLRSRTLHLHLAAWRLTLGRCSWLTASMLAWQMRKPLQRLLQPLLAHCSLHAARTPRACKCQQVMLQPLQVRLRACHLRNLLRQRPAAPRIAGATCLQLLWPDSGPDPACHAWPSAWAQCSAGRTRTGACSGGLPRRGAVVRGRLPYVLCCFESSVAALRMPAAWEGA